MISVIIPALNEAEGIEGVVRKIRERSSGGVREIIVVDGGSNDGTQELARQAGAKVIQSEKKGRAVQMNAGAKVATEELLYFLHADSVPPTQFDRLIREAVRGNDQAGCFRLSFDDPHPALKFYSWFTRFDIDLFRFGDQSLFITSELFQKIGGFNEDLLVMEDQEIIGRIKKETAFEISAQAVVTSARKYRDVGFLKLQLIFTLILCLYYIGMSQETLVSFYREMLRES